MDRGHSPKKLNSIYAEHETLKAQLGYGKHPLESEDQRTVAAALADMLLNQTERDVTRVMANMGETLNERAVLPKPAHRARTVLDQIVDVIWRHAHHAQAQEYRSNIDSVIKSREFDPLMASSVAKLGHINEMAGLIARDNVFHNMHKHGVATPGGIRELMQRFPDCKTAIGALGKPTFWLTLTAHPTSTNDLQSIKMQRRLLNAIDAFRQAPGEQRLARFKDLQQAVDNFAVTPVMPMNGNKTTNLTVAQEIEQSLYFLENVYHDVPRIYKRYDQPMSEKFGKEYNPHDLNLNIKFSSWGSSGDKDGNPNVSAETTLQGMIMHRLKATKCYGRELANIDAKELRAWKERLPRDEQRLRTLLAEYNDALAKAPKEIGKDGKEGKAHLRPEEFDHFSAQLKTISRGLDAASFQNDIDRAYAHGHDERMLTLSRRARIFAFNFGRLEYRETAEEYTRIIEGLIPGYKGMSTARRTEALSGLLDMPADTLLAHTQEARAKMQAAWERAYTAKDDNDATPIGYHTLKRMELARDFPDMVSDNVLAECQDTSNFLEALLLQRLATKDGVTPQLGIVPLFEDRKALDNCVKTMQNAWDNRHYAAHMQALGNVQQTQLAHSDNARRSGMPGARAYIYEAHQKLRELGEKRGVTMQFYEGGSQSDPYRGGIRSMTSTIKEFGISDFAKFTFQGGDLLNYLNYTPSVMRLFTRIISHCADTLYKGDEASTFAGKEAAKKAANGNGTDPKKDAIAIKALKETVADYENRVMKNDEANDFMKDIGYIEETDAGGATSRPKKKGGAGKVDVNDMRTIGFSEALQHAGITPTWLGGGNLKTHLRQANGGQVTPAILHEFYEKSPVFRDVVDRMLFGLAKSDLDAVKRGYAARHNFVNYLEAEYRDVYQLAMEARTGIAYPHNKRDKDGKEVSCTQLRDNVIDQALPHLKDDLASKMGYLDIVSNLRSRCLLSTQAIDELNQKLDALDKKEKGYKDENKIIHLPQPLTKDEASTRSYYSERLADDASLRRLLHNAGDTVHHGRYLMADDNHYGLYRMALESVRKAIKNLSAPAGHANSLAKTHIEVLTEKAVKAQLAMNDNDPSKIDAYQTAIAPYESLAHTNGKSRSRAA